MENNIISIAKKFNQEHGRAMTYEEALQSQMNVDNATYDSCAELYAESVKQFERTKVIEEVEQLRADLIQETGKCMKYQQALQKINEAVSFHSSGYAREVHILAVEALKSHPLDTNEK